MTAVLDGKPVLGTPREIQEVLNAFSAYEAWRTGSPRAWTICWPRTSG